MSYKPSAISLAGRFNALKPRYFWKIVLNLNTMNWQPQHGLKPCRRKLTANRMTALQHGFCVMLRQSRFRIWRVSNETWQQSTVNILVLIGLTALESRQLFVDFEDADMMLLCRL